MQTDLVNFKGMPLFQRARFNESHVMLGEIKDFACFFYLKTGTMSSYDSRGVHQIKEREAITKNCGTYVQKFELSAGEEGCEAIAVYLYPELLKEIYKDEIPSFIVSNEIPKPKKFIANKLIEQYMNNLSIYFESPESIDEELSILKLKELIMIMLKSENHNDVRKLLSELFNPVHQAFERTIKSNLYNPLNIEELAHICNMSLSSFKRKFKEVYKQTPAKYIKHSRLEKAANLLLCNSDNINTIAYECGFQDVTTFNANFLAHFGESPSKYRLNQIGKH